MTERSLTLAFLADPGSVHSRRWIGAFARRGHRVHIFVPRGADASGLPAGVEIEPYVDYGRRLRPAGALRAAVSLRRRLAMVDPDVVHAHYVTRFGWIARIADRHPIVVTAWGSDVLRASAMSPLARWMTRRTLASADLVTVVSDELGRAAVAAGAHADRVRRVQFGVDGSRFTPGPADEGLRERLGVVGRRVVLSPRWIRPIYRQETVVEAMAALPDDVVVLMTGAGADPATLRGLLGTAARLGVAERLRVLDGIEHTAMPDLYRLADVVVSVPESDAFPVTALEAMACARPLVLSDQPSAREGLAGVEASGLAATRLVPVGDAGTTAAAIGALLELAPAARSAAGPALRAAALERGDETRNMDRMEAYYLALAERREPGP